MPSYSAMKLRASPHEYWLILDTASNDPETRYRLLVEFNMEKKEAVVIFSSTHITTRLKAGKEAGMHECPEEVCDHD